MRDPALRPKTTHSYLNAADGLLRQAEHADLARLKQAEVDRYLCCRPGQRASLARFLAHAGPGTGMKLAIPRRRRRANPKAREKVLLREMRVLLDRLDRATETTEGRAVPATTNLKIYAVPLSAVLALKASDVAGGERHGALPLA